MKQPTFAEKLTFISNFATTNGLLNQLMYNLKFLSQEKQKKLIEKLPFLNKNLFSFPDTNDTNKKRRHPILNQSIKDENSLFEILNLFNIKGYIKFNNSKKSLKNILNLLEEIDFSYINHLLIEEIKKINHYFKSTTFKGDAPLIVYWPAVIDSKSQFFKDYVEEKFNESDSLLNEQKSFIKKVIEDFKDVFGDGDGVVVDDFENKKNFFINKYIGYQHGWKHTRFSQDQIDDLFIDILGNLLTSFVLAEAVLENKESLNDSEKQKELMGKAKDRFVGITNKLTFNEGFAKEIIDKIVDVDDDNFFNHIFTSEDFDIIPQFKAYVNGRLAEIKALYEITKFIQKNDPSSNFFTKFETDENNKIILDENLFLPKIKRDENNEELSLSGIVSQTERFCVLSQCYPPTESDEVNKIINNQNKNFPTAWKTFLDEIKDFKKEELQKFQNIIKEKPDFLIFDKFTKTLMIGMVQNDLYDGGSKLNRAEKYINKPQEIEDFNNSDDKKSKIKYVFIPVVSESLVINSQENNKKKDYAGQLMNNGYFNENYKSINQLHSILKNNFLFSPQIFDFLKEIESKELETTYSFLRSLFNNINEYEEKQRLIECLKLFDSDFGFENNGNFKITFNLRNCNEDNSIEKLEKEFIENFNTENQKNYEDIERYEELNGNITFVFEWPMAINENNIKKHEKKLKKLKEEINSLSKPTQLKIPTKK